MYAIRSYYVADQPMVYVSDKPAFQENILNSKAAAVMATAGFIVEKEAYETKQVIEDVPRITSYNVCYTKLLRIRRWTSQYSMKYRC